MSLRPARLEDVLALIPLLREFYAEDAHPFDAPAARAALVGLLEDPDRGRAFLIEDGGVLVGYLVVTFGYSLEFRGKDAFVDELYVRAAHRGRGLGREALHVAEACCREAGARALHLEVRDDNAAAQRLYRSWGFASRPNHLMSKPLLS